MGRGFDKPVVDLFDCRDEMAAHVEGTRNTALIAGWRAARALVLYPTSTASFSRHGVDEQGNNSQPAGRKPGGFFSSAFWRSDPHKLGTIVPLGGVDTNIGRERVYTVIAPSPCNSQSSLTKAVSSGRLASVGPLFLGRLLFFRTTEPSHRECERWHGLRTGFGRSRIRVWP